MATETSALTGLEPRAFWSHFEALTRIARPSRHEEPAIEHVRAWAAEHGFDQARVDRGRLGRVEAVPAVSAGQIRARHSGRRRGRDDGQVDALAVHDVEHLPVARAEQGFDVAPVLGEGGLEP